MLPDEIIDLILSYADMETLSKMGEYAKNILQEKIKSYRLRSNYYFSIGGSVFAYPGGSSEHTFRKVKIIHEEPVLDVEVFTEGFVFLNKNGSVMRKGEPVFYSFFHPDPLKRGQQVKSNNPEYYDILDTNIRLIGGENRVDFGTIITVRNDGSVKIMMNDKFRDLKLESIPVEPIKIKRFLTNLIILDIEGNLWLWKDILLNNDSDELIKLEILHVKDFYIDKYSHFIILDEIGSVYVMKFNVSYENLTITKTDLKDIHQISYGGFGFIGTLNTNGDVYIHDMIHLMNKTSMEKKSQKLNLNNIVSISDYFALEIFAIDDQGILYMGKKDYENKWDIKKFSYADA